MIQSLGNWVDTKKFNSSYNLFFDVINPMPNSIYIQVEPEAIIPRQEFLQKNWRFFKYIITFNEEVLKLPNARKYISGCSWITPQEYNSIKEKEFKISTIVGDKTITKGHLLRQKLLQANLSNVNYYVSSSKVHLAKPLVGPSKFKTFQTYQYQIVIENSQQINYFSEKLGDCLITKTIPIYWGCPNISEYFDTSGWIFFTDIEDLTKKINELTSTYSIHKLSIEENYKKAIEYSDFLENINKTLKVLTI